MTRRISLVAVCWSSATNGEIAVPTGPGLGVELDMGRIASLRVDR